MTLDQVRAVVHDDPPDPVTRASPAVLAVGRPGDADGDDHRRRLDTDIATLDIGDAFKFEDDGPSIDPSAATADLMTDETDLPNDSGSVSFAGLFTAGFGNDGFKDADDNNVEDAGRDQLQAGH